MCKCLLGSFFVGLFLYSVFALGESVVVDLDGWNDRPPAGMGHSFVGFNVTLNHDSRFSRSGHGKKWSKFEPCELILCSVVHSVLQ